MSAHVNVLEVIDAVVAELRSMGNTGHVENLLDARAATAELIEQRNDLNASLEIVMHMEVRGHQLQDRLQFSDVGRAILHQATSSLARAKGSSSAALGRDASSNDAATALLIRGVSSLLASESTHMTHRNAKERDAYKTIRTALAALGRVA
jgi:hypothetical protein